MTIQNILPTLSRLDFIVTEGEMCVSLTKTSFVGHKKLC